MYNIAVELAGKIREIMSGKIAVLSSTDSAAPACPTALESSEGKSSSSY